MKSDEFIREVDEELQRDRLQALWRRYGRLLIGAVVLLVVGVAAWEGWKAWRAHQIEAVAERLVAVEQDMAAQRWQEAADGFAAIAADAEPNPAAVARLREAAARLRAGNAGEAMAALELVAASNGADPLLRELAALLGAQQSLDSADPAELRSRLVPLADAGRPWRNSARELLALLAIRTGETDQARATLDTLIADAEVSPAQRQRAEALRAGLGAVPQ